jgi:TRAP-type C4-dicarboxylate transport system substrate-binding protein
MKKAFIATGIIVLMLLLFPFNSAFPKSKAIVLKFAHYFPAPAKQSKICEEFITELEKRTNGSVEVRYFPGGSLLKAPAMIKGIQKGIADIGFSHIEYTPGRMPVTEVAELPLGYQTGWLANQIMNDFYNEFKPTEWDRFKVLWFHANSPSLIITKKPVRALEDMKGLTIRAPGRFGDVIRALGGTPAPTPIMETYDAIAKGVIDGVFAPYETLRTFRFAEVAKYVTVTWHIGPCYPFYVAMSKRSYQKLPKDIQEILDTLAGEYKERMALVWNSVEFAGKAFGEKQGVEYIELSKDESDRWKKAVEPVIEDYVKSMTAKGYAESDVRGWIKYIKERTDYLIKKQIVYQIKSVTGPPEVRP